MHETVEPRSPFFYGKIRINKKYITKSFAPITSRDEAEKELYIWRDELFNISTTVAGNIKEELSNRSEYIDQEELSNDPNFGSSKPPEQGFDKNWLCKYGIEIFD